MADNRIQIKIELEKGGATASLKNFEGEVIKSGVAVGNLRKELGNFVVSSRRMSNSVNLTQKELRSLEKTVGGFKTATGGATSAAMELGRVVSDAPYGIRGMANNVSQLASQITYMANATDITTGKTVGFVGAIKSVGRALMGTTGILFLIQGAIAAVDYFANRVDEADKKNKKLNDTIGAGATKLSALKDALDNGNLSREQANEAVSLANKEYKDLNLKLDENNKLTSDSVERMEAQIDMLIKLAKARALQSILEEKYSELLRLQAKQTDLDTEAKEKNKAATDALSESYKEQGLAVSLALAKSAEDAANENKKASDEIEKDIKRLLELAGNEGLIEKMFKGKAKKKPKAKTLDGLPTAEEVRDYYSDVFKALSESNSFEKALDQLNVARASGHITEEFFNEMKESLKKKFESENIMNGIAPKLELGENAKKAIDDYNKKLLEDFAKRMRQEEMIEYGEALSENLSTISSFIDSEYERRLTTEQNYTNALNEQLNQRLLNENLSKEERASIQQEIWQNDENLRKKQNEIKKKQFNNQKAFNIAKATIDTYTAATGVLKDTKGGSFARIAGMIAVIGSGLAQVAMIAKQKFQPEAASTPIRTAGGGGGGGGVGDRSFNFNLVGANQQNQLVNAIQSQFDKPLKAYVVSKDITNQMALDANIKSTARFGG